ncbi:hypothetical protein TSUD_285340 [Trifolium subterraneum]|uniref:Uncharacterized protein n=1 Tax=Trifolium subterraneum TaxID=3900 RepID=A0A2Z6PGM4_TRISU|nr:hypothetical protein TSUD_285340 [Trifolium subterraneum]
MWQIRVLLARGWLPVMLLRAGSVGIAAAARSVVFWDFGETPHGSWIWVLVSVSFR